MASPSVELDEHHVNSDSNIGNNKNKQTQTQVPTEMRAEVLKALGIPCELVNPPTPILTSSNNPHNLLIKVTAATYCHTDHVLATGGMTSFPPHFMHLGCHAFADVVVASSPNYTPDPNNPSILEVDGQVGVLGRAFHPCGSCFECCSAPTVHNQDDDNDQDKPGYSVYCPHALGHGISSPGDFQQYVIIDSRQVAPISPSISDLRASSSGGQGSHLYASDPRAHFFLASDMSECTLPLLSSFFSIPGGSSRRPNQSLNNSLPVPRHSRNPDDLQAAMTPKHSSKTLAPWSIFQDGSLMTITPAGWEGILASFVSCALKHLLRQLHRQLRSYNCQATLAYFVRCGAALPSPAPDRFGCVTTQNPHPGAGMLTGFPFATRGTSYPLKTERRVLVPVCQLGAGALNLVKGARRKRFATSSSEPRVQRPASGNVHVKKGGQGGPGGVSLLRQLRSMTMPPPRFEGGWGSEM